MEPVRKYPYSIQKFLKDILKPFRWHLFGLTMMTTVWALDLSIRPYLLKIILDRLVSTPIKEVFFHLSTPTAWYIFMSTMIILSQRSSDIIRLKLIPNLKKNITQKMFSQLMGHNHEYYQDHFIGSLANKLNDVVNGVPQIINIIVDRLFSQILGLLIAIYTLSVVDIKFTLIIAVWISIFLIFSLAYTKKACRFSDAASEARSNLTGKIVDILNNIISVRYFANKSYENQRLNKTLEEVVISEQQVQWFLIKIWAFQNISYIIMQSISLYLLIKGRQNGLITAGDFALILTLNMHILNCMWNMGRDFSEFTDHYGKVVQGLTAIIQENQALDSEDVKELSIKFGKIQFENVYFNYKNVPLLFNNKSITIQPGEKIGLVGYSGSGKSTFVNLILRLFDIRSGRILIDEQDVSKITHESLMKSIAVIPQEPCLFHRSLMENIRYGKITASDNEVIKASKRAYAHEFIILTENGYDSLVGERGVKLSVGQRQRIAIARAILKNAPILILDEATSAVDSVTEGYIQESLVKLMKQKTVIVIAHRLSTLLNLDRILVFDKGKIIEDGTHEQLLSINGKYATLWNSQIGGFLLDGSNNETKVKNEFSKILA